MEKSEKKRGEILDAAMLCLARYGPLKSTMDDIAKILGLKKASLYYYYESKECIFRDALEREAQRFQEKLSSKFKGIKTAREKIIILMRSVHRYFRTRAEMLDVNIQAMVDNHALLQNLSRNMRSSNVDLLAGLIREGISSGEFRDVDEFKLSHAIRLMFDTQRLELYQNITERKLSDKEYKELESESVFILEIFLDGLTLGR